MNWEENLGPELVSRVQAVVDDPNSPYVSLEHYEADASFHYLFHCAHAGMIGCEDIAEFTVPVELANPLKKWLDMIVVALLANHKLS